MNWRVHMLAVVLVLCLATSEAAQAPETQARKGGKPEVVSLCDILASAESYRDKSVVVRGTLRIDFEASELYCLSCLSKGRTWVEFSSPPGSGAEESKAGKQIEKLSGRGWLTVNGVFSGTFHPNGNYGHLNAYQHKLVVYSVSNLHVVDKLGLAPSRLPPESRKKACR